MNTGFDLSYNAVLVDSLMTHDLKRPIREAKVVVSPDRMDYSFMFVNAAPRLVANNIVSAETDYSNR